MSTEQSSSLFMRFFKKIILSCEVSYPRGILILRQTPKICRRYFDSKEEKDSWLLAMKADFQKRKGQASKSKKSTTQNVSAKPRKQRGEQSGLDV